MSTTMLSHEIHQAARIEQARALGAMVSAAFRSLRDFGLGVFSHGGGGFLRSR